MRLDSVRATLITAVDSHSLRGHVYWRKYLYHSLHTYPVCIRVTAPDPEDRMGYRGRLGRLTDITLICRDIKVHGHHTGG